MGLASFTSKKYLDSQTDPAVTSGRGRGNGSGEGLILSNAGGLEK
jgi:hypothetical protein